MININKIKASNERFSNGLIDAMYEETSFTETANGAKTLARTKSALVDFFAQAGAMRGKKDEALELFKRAFSEDNLIATRLLFYLRDVRGGQGERDLFRNCLQYLGEQEKEVFEKIVKYVPEYGRWDDLFFDNEKVFEFIKKQIDSDVNSETPSLLGKWLKTINASSKNTREKAKFIAGKLGLTNIAYRRVVRFLRKKIQTVEELMSARKWSDIKYENVPSQASLLYKNAFTKHDKNRYEKYIDDVNNGEKKINASTLYPYQLYDKAFDGDNSVEALWKNLPDYTRGTNALVVADTSGSMEGRPMSVSVSLALYFAERNKGIFKNCFISFSEDPKIHKIKGMTLRQKMNSIKLGDVANTNIQSVFSLILGTAIKNNIPEEEMPETIYIISDMEFDNAVCGRTNYEIIKRRYKESGYKKPNIVFWNVNGNGENLPSQDNEKGVTMVSGLSASTFSLAVENKTPYEMMLDVANSDRYNKIVL
ncbi:MAG TPA: DUF2828 family protein [Candidatus Cloacimonas acidaminovorans]|nr:DUF2828 family protein [Candidatus Cloacimonas acidaminovorans]